MDLVISFILGTIASLVAAYLYARYSSKVIQNRYKSLEGWWFEVIETSTDRSYSTAKFVFDPKSNTYSFDGQNFKNDGEPFCSWSSISIQVDQTARRIFYIFRSYVKGEGHNDNHGFGVINFSVNKVGDPIPESGYYIEARVNGTPHTHSMERLENVCAKLGLAAKPNETEELFHQRIVVAIHAKRISTGDF